MRPPARAPGARTRCPPGWCRAKLSTARELTCSYAPTAYDRVSSRRTETRAIATTDKQKQSLYFPEDMLREITTEANRLDRSLSWIVQRAWAIARGEIRTFPAAHRVGAEGPRVPRARPGHVHRPNGEPPAPQPVAVEREPRASREVLEFVRGKFDRDVTG